MKKKILGIFIFTLLLIVTVIPATGEIQKKPVSPLVSTSVDNISPYYVPSTPLVITATGPSDLDDVTLFYRWSKDNVTWGENAVTYETGVIDDVNDWTTVNLDNNYDNPIVIVTGQEGADISLDVEKSRPRIRDVNSNSFEVIVTNDIGSTVTEDVGYIVMEEGHWTIDGVEVEAGTYNVTSTSPQEVTFIEAFPDNTVVVDTIQEETEVGSSRYTENSMTSTSYSVYWEEYDNDGNNIGPVKAGYIAVEYGSLSDLFESSIEQEVDDDSGSGTWTSVTFSNSYSSTPVLFTNPLDDYGGDPCIVGRSNLDSSGFNIRVTEGQNQDSELDHVPCDIPWIVWKEITVDVAVWKDWNDISNPDTSYPWSWNFNFPNGTGYYEFYSIGKKTGEEDEQAPTVADASCRYNLIPEIFNEYPINGSTDIQIKPELEISVLDADGDEMTLKWYSNSEGSWKIFASNRNIENGIYSQVNSNFSEFETTYWWYVTLTDNIYTNYSPIFHFTTEENLPPNTPSNPDPPDEATDVSINEILTWTGGDPNYGDTVSYDVYFGKSSPPPLVAEDIHQTAYDPGTMDLDTTYFWQIVSEDSQGESKTGSIWTFTTQAEANTPPTRPDIYGSPQGPPGVELCWLFVSRDFEQHQVRYIIDWGDGNTEETDYYPEGNGAEACHTFEELGEYTIIIKAEDEKGSEGLENTFTIKIQNSRTVFYPWLLRLSERFPMLERLMSLFKILWA
jgi:hypothetical protein